MTGATQFTRGAARTYGTIPPVIDGGSSEPLLAVLEAYYDSVPRFDAAIEQIGPFTLFVKSGPGWPYYARPTLGASRVTVSDVQRVYERQRELGIPQTFEWVAEMTPSLAGAARQAGLSVNGHPLMIHGDPVQSTPPWPKGVEVRLVSASEDLCLVNAIGRVAFGAAGTAAGTEGVDVARAAVESDPARVAAQQERLRTGRTITAVALVHTDPVGIGSHQPVDEVTEIVGVAVLPAFRRRGVGSAITSVLVEDARKRGIGTIFLSASDEAVARIYARIGFVRVGTACGAEPPTGGV